ncbi:MAG: glycosyltransferase family 9 protein [Sedimentisphaerales bacterium]|nr:glycosyltransferase family 9 protein [Sedimentisphaerales bacterium]
MAIPALDCIRENFPQAKMIGILKPNAQGILRDGPWFDHFINCEDKSWKGFWSMVRQLKSFTPDIAVVMPNSIRSVLTLWLGGIKKRYGYRRSARNVFLSGGPKPKYEKSNIIPLPMQDYYLEICNWMGLRPPRQKKPRLYIGPELKQRGRQLLEKYGIKLNDLVIGINPGASYGSSKCWPADYFARTSDLLRKEMNARLLLLSGPGEDAIVEAILEKTSADIIDTRPDRIDLELLKPLIQRCNLLITNDTGPRHYAVAFDVPVIVIMGPTDPRYTAANLEKTIVLREELACSPCHKKQCPTDHECMRKITPEKVLEAGRELLQRSDR